MMNHPFFHFIGSSLNHLEKGVGLGGSDLIFLYSAFYEGESAV